MRRRVGCARLDRVQDVPRLVPQAVRVGGQPAWALHDGIVSCEPNLLPAADPAGTARSTDAHGFLLDPIRVDVNVFAFQGPLGLTLVNAGMRPALGAHLGHLGGALAACGIVPAAVGTPC